MLWAAQLEMGDSLLDCIVLDISPRGARLRFRVPVAVPDGGVVRLRLRDGTRYPARRRWSRGTLVGLEFLGPGAALTADAATARRARALLEAVQAGPPAAWLPMLQAERFFGDEALRLAAEAVELAHARLEAALRAHAATAAASP